LKTKDILLILRAGDVPDASYIPSAINLLACQPQISFVGCWKYIIKLGTERLETYPLDLMLETALFEGQPVLSRCLMLTATNKPLLELFDPAADELGEMAYLWRLNNNEPCGLMIPDPLIRINEENEKPFSTKLFSYILLQEQSPKRLRLLARYLFIHYNLMNGSEKSTQDESHEDNSPNDWGMKPAFRNLRRDLREYLNKSWVGESVLHILIRIWGWFNKLGRA
jgi:hypothetical protein